MQCPNDSTTLVMTDRAGIEIDYCPQCRGVWLDRGELDKIIDRSEQQAGPAQATQPPVHSSAPVPGQEYYQHPPQRPRLERPEYADDGHDYHRKYNKKHKKESFLGDLFDF